MHFILTEDAHFLLPAVSAWFRSLYTNAIESMYRRLAIMFNKQHPLLHWCLVFTGLHLATAIVLYGIFGWLSDLLPLGLSALDFYGTFSLSPVDHLIRGLVLALVLYPIKKKGRLDWKNTLTALFVVGLIGSVEPQPGTIEGLIYTITTPAEHLLVILAEGLRILFFLALLSRWDLLDENVTEIDIPTRSYRRFLILHLFTYWGVGMLFYQISGYEEALATDTAFLLYRDLESLSMVGLVLFGQIFRGLLLAVSILRLTGSRPSTGTLFLQLFGLTALGGPLFAASFFDGLLQVESIGELLASLVIGIPEITAQMLVFSTVFVLLTSRKAKDPIKNTSTE
jgi:hypothetical protein